MNANAGTRRRRRHRTTDASRPAPSARFKALGGPADGGQSKRPAEILRDTASALRASHGYEMRGTVTQARRPTQVTMLVTAARSVEMTATIDHGIYQVRRVPGGLYVRGDSSFSTAHFGTRAAVLANHWLQVPATTKLAELGLFAPGTMARCLQEGHGTLTVAGTTAVDGQRAIVLRDAGDQPGTQPGTLAVAATGPPYPPSPDRLG